MAEQRRKPVRQALAENAPWMPPKWEDADVGALQALARGDAQPHQQQRALNFIVKVLCDNDGLGWFPTGDHDSSFAAGRRYPGVQISRLLRINLSKLEQLRRDPNG